MASTVTTDELSIYYKVYGHLLKVCKLSIQPGILGVVLGMLKHKTRWVSDFFSYLRNLQFYITFLSPSILSK